MAVLDDDEQRGPRLEAGGVPPRRWRSASDAPPVLSAAVTGVPGISIPDHGSKQARRRRSAPPGIPLEMLLAESQTLSAGSTTVSNPRAPPQMVRQAE